VTRQAAGRARGTTKPTPSRARGVVTHQRGLPIVAIVGRPNVGKSTLFNRLARKRLAIVHDEPGVTRDRHYAETTAFGRPYMLVDTGGFDPESDDPMRSHINEHVQEAIDEADAIVFVTDGTAPLTSADRAAVNLLRRSAKKVYFACNKVDGPKGDPDAFEIYRLGVKNVFPVSALHGRGVGELEAEFVRGLPALDVAARESDEEEEEDEGLVRIALVGRPNAGKSSLTNRMFGEARMLVDDKPGTTRDTIDLYFERGETRYLLADTAGIRKKGRVTKADDAVESLSVLSAIRGIERAHVVVLVCDAEEGVAEQDAKILGLAEDRGRAMVIALNKCDLLDASDQKKAEERARDKLTFAPYAPVVRISAKTGRGVGELFETIASVHREYRKRVSTGELNRFFEKVMENRSPPTSGGKAPRVYYVTQAETSPPLFVVMARDAESLHFSYRRYVKNQLRKHFGFEGVPVRVAYREKRGRSDAKKEEEGNPRPPPHKRLTRRRS
jgi:GTP-binding protein